MSINKIHCISPKAINPNWDPFYKFVARSIKYPSEARANNVTGRNQITFNVKNGKVANLSIVKRLGSGCEEEVMRAILSYQGFDESYDGNYAFVTAFAFTGESRIITKEEIKPLEGFTNLNQVVIVAYKNQQGDRETAKFTEIVSPTKDKITDSRTIEKQPEFPGGLKKFYEYLAQNIHYPAAAVGSVQEGKVSLAFTVEKDGSLTDIAVTRGVSKEIDAEAIRVMQESPKWNPGVQNGKFVRVRYNIAVNFNLGKKANIN
ncbi:MAG: TonB family protein [Pedobacter sp.]|nr:TonB family protein [Pedobacter sp.]